MRCLLPVLVIVLTACQTGRTLTLANGTTYVDRGHLAGNNTILIKPDGTVILHEKMNEPWKDAMQVIGTALVASSAASVSKAEVAAAKATDLGAQKAAVQTAGIKAEVQKAKIAADVEKTLIKHPPEVIPVP